jgi:sterol desaturase/sphingolipid hydroxylase (fatty acid hydroxylase superfamily)
MFELAALIPSLASDSPLARMAIISAAIALLAAIEAVLPLHPRNRWSRGHLGPNLALTGLTFATNLLFTAALVLVLDWQQAHDIGLLHGLTVPPLIELAVVVLALDLAFYVVHVAMHRYPALWRYHRVHHSDAAVDVTTTIRQHPGETVIRYAAIAAFALPLGASAGSFAIYQLCAALGGLLEHANMRLPQWVNRGLALVVTWPDMHKVHHSRDQRFTNTNYGNLVSWWDRLFGTFTPAREGRAVAYGLEGTDEQGSQTITGLLALPFRDLTAQSGSRSASWARESSAAR